MEISYWNRKAAPSTSSSSTSSVAAAGGTRFRWVFRPRRRRVMPTVRLGDGKPSRGGRRLLLIIRVVRRARVRWEKLKKSSVLKKLKELYRSLIRDVLDSGATIDAFHHRLLLETSFTALPLMPITFNSFPVAHNSI
ncbi:uncharacterized protein LOC124914153 [Impatiens glandulifera]|uniref:uncharacterized protein LOC124914153 n=1 Tax=Impatiens glandulifera TaxID=253017 RepID=UPI001FB09BAB|nr:uncharacterized protein LOC124914153 [Impatiens glandulifera]